MNCYFMDCDKMISMLSRYDRRKEPERQYKESIPYGAHLGEKRGMWWGRDEKNR